MPMMWYENFLSKLSVPCSLLITSSESVFYVVHIPTVDFKQLNNGHYRLHVFLYDTLCQQFFGKQFVCETTVKENSLYVEPPMLFFHTNITDNRFIVVCEIVKLDSTPWVYAWTAIPVLLRSVALTEYGSQNHENPPLSRFKLYAGSCVCLAQINNLDELDKRLKKIDGILSASIQLNTRINKAIPFVPENYFISPIEEIPGLHLANNNVSLADTVTVLVDNIVLSYSGGDSLSIEKAITDMLMYDYCLRINKPRQTNNNEHFSIIERRLKIGVHNSFCYIEEPHYLYLYQKEQSDVNASTLRRRSRSLGRSPGTILSAYANEFFARNCVRLTRLCADASYAIIFSIDYHIGFCDNTDSVRESQWVMIAWNAWCPFQNNAFTISDTITIPLVGGPRPNPDDTFCFKSLMNYQQGIRPQNMRLGLGVTSNENTCFNLKFNFAVVEAFNSGMLMLPENRQVSALRKTPSPKPDFPAIVSPVSPRKNNEIEEIPYLNLNAAEIKENYVEYLEPAVCHETALKRRQSSREPVVEILKFGEEPSVDNRVSAFSRAVARYFMRFNFQQIMPADEWQVLRPTLVNPLDRRHLSVETELSSKFEANEIVFQFMAIQTLSNRYYNVDQRPARYFFTFKFYRFGKVTTEKMTSLAKNEQKFEMPSVFQRIDDSALVDEYGHGFMTRFILHKSAIPLNDADDFARYLMKERLYVDVWNADSLFHVGVCTVPLNVMCRQNANAVYSEVQCTIVQQGLPDCSGSIATGLLYLRVANIGRHSEKHHQHSFVRGAGRICHQNNSERFCQRARPLHAIHDNALQRFLSAQKLDLYQRKEEIFSNDQWRRVERWKEFQKHSSSVINAPMKRFIFCEELKAYKTLRSESKASALLRAVFRGITTRYTVHAKYGQVEFFEFLLRNTFAEQILCVVDISDSRLNLVFDVEEWKFYKNHFNLRTPLECDLFNIEEYGDKRAHRVTLLLGAMESVCVPFKFDGIRDVGQLDESNPSEIRVIFKRADTDEPVGILEVNIENRDLSISRSLRLFCEESHKMSRVFELRGGNRNIVACRVSLPSAICSLHSSKNGNKEVHFSCNVGHSPDVQTFILMFYADRYFCRQLAVWELYIHSTRRLNVQGIQAQLTKIPLPLKSTLARESSMLIRLFSSSNAITFHPPQTFTNDAQHHDAQALFLPNFTGTRMFVINTVHVQSNRLLLSWTVSAKVSEPNVVKVYDIKIATPFDRSVAKHINVTNEYGMIKRWRIHTSNERLVSAAQEYYVVKPHTTIQIQLDFHPITVDTETRHKVLVFVEDAELVQQEEAYSLEITYLT